MTATQSRERVRPSHSGKSNGQWAVDGRAPLNHNEEYKAEDNGLNVRRRVEEIYSKQGFDSIPHDDLYGRFRWWGIYTQRRQGIDGGRTGSLSDEDMSDKFFMLRVRIDGGILTTAALRVLGEISVDFARGTADITDRQNLQYHWIAIEDMPEVWRRLESVGLQTTTACGDTPRGFLCSPVAGVAKDELIDSSKALLAIRDRYIGDPEFTNLPRKYKTAVTGHPSRDVVHEINDFSLVAIEHPELGIGYDLWVGGALSVTPRLAERIGVFVREDEAAELWAAVTGIFRDYGYRRLRNKARMKFLMADWGAEKFRQVLEDEYLHRKLPDSPPPAPAKGAWDHIGVHEQKDGRRFVGLAPTVGRMTGERLIALADAIEKAGSTRLRFTPFQKIIVLDIEPELVDGLLADVDPIGLTAFPSPFRRNTMACTGIEFCKLAFVNTKDTAADTIAEMEKRLADVVIDTPITLNINGCPNSCARIQVADIGLKGQLMKSADGEPEFAFQVHLGGGLESENREEPGLGKTVRGLKVLADQLPDYVERVVRSFLAHREPGETFSHWVWRADDADLS